MSSYIIILNFYSSFNLVRNELWILLRFNCQGSISIIEKNIKMHVLRSAHGHKTSSSEHLRIKSKSKKIKSLSQVGFCNIILIGLLRNPGLTIVSITVKQSFYQNQVWSLFRKI